VGNTFASEFKLKCTMKKLFTLVALLATVGLAKAQEFKPFKVDLAVGYAMPAGSGSKAGVLFAIEPKYAVQDQISLGLRLEAAVVARALAESYSADVKAIGSYVLTGDYYFGTNKSRVFAGLGAGLFRYAAAAVQVDEQENYTIAAYNKFGIVPRIGAELGHFRLGLEYNLVPKEMEIKNGYLSFKMGMFIGGGKN